MITKPTQKAVTVIKLGLLPFRAARAVTGWPVRGIRSVAARGRPTSMPTPDDKAKSISPIRPDVERIHVLDSRGRLRISPTIVPALSATVGALEAETGAILGFTKGRLNRLRFDERASCSGATYAPDVKAANDERRAIERDGGVFCGIVHSHPGLLGVPSAEDRVYAQRILRNARVDQLVLPIVLPGNGGASCRINWYLARPGATDEAEIVAVEVAVASDSLSGQFDRVMGAYDVDWLVRCRIVAVGCGGAREALEGLARIGVGQFVLIDPDIVTGPNLATQAVYRRELGRPKVHACADAIREINPDAVVVAVERSIEEIVPRQLDILLSGRWAGSPAPVRVVVGTWTDDHAANAYGHRAAVAAGLPVVSASLHAHGASGEIILAYPGRTKGCIRCATKSRYDHYLAGGVNNATSAGAPLWATTRLNALKMCVTVAALHAVEPGECGRPSRERRVQTALLEKIARRPMAIMRLSPDARTLSGVTHHDRVFSGCDQPDRLLFDETVWRGVDAVPGCPDCGGSGYGGHPQRVHPWLRRPLDREAPA